MKGGQTLRTEVRSCMVGSDMAYLCISARKYVRTGVRYVPTVLSTYVMQAEIYRYVWPEVKVLVSSGRTQTVGML